MSTTTTTAAPSVDESTSVADPIEAITEQVRAIADPKSPEQLKAERDAQPVEPRFKAKAGDTTSKSSSKAKSETTSPAPKRTAAPSPHAFKPNPKKPSECMCGRRESAHDASLARKPETKPTKEPAVATPKKSTKSPSKPKSTPAPKREQLPDVPTGSVRFSVPGAAHAALVEHGSAATKATLSTAVVSQRSKGASYVVTCTTAKAKALAADATKHAEHVAQLPRGERTQPVRIAARACSQLADKIDDVLAG